MRRKVSGREDEFVPTNPAPPKPEQKPVVIPHDATNEAIIVAAAFLFERCRTMLITRLVPDHFLQREHRELWQAFQEAERRKLVLDLALVERLTSSDLARYLAELIEIRAAEPANLPYHLQCVLWDHARATAARGPIPAFIEALRDPRSEPEKVRGLARSVAASFDGYEDRQYLLDPGEVARDQMKEIDRRVAGEACFSYGIPGLDWYDPDTRLKRRMIPGTAPGQVTVITGVSGSGKTTMTANIVLGIAFPGWRDGDFETPGRKVTYGAFEMQGGMTLEVLACISLRWLRGDLMSGVGIVATNEGRSTINARMEIIAQRVRFLANPFRRRVGEKRSNERNLDLLQGYLADAGGEVFVADLWKRVLARSEPDDEEEALIRQQMMCEELRQHGILLQQQRLKDIEMRQDKRPTREGIKGSGAWVEIPDTIIGVHRDAIWKRVDDTQAQGLVLKQRYGKWPLAIEFDWDSDRGLFSGGRHFEYARPGEGSELDRGLLDVMGKR